MKKFSLPKDGGLIEAGLPNGIKHSYERIPAHIFEDEEVASAELASRIAASINASEGVYKLGLTTGSSPVTLYRELVALYEAGKVSFANVEIYSIDEYYPAPADSQSRNRRLYDELVSKVDVFLSCQRLWTVRRFLNSAPGMMLWRQVLTSLSWEQERKAR